MTRREFLEASTSVAALPGSAMAGTLGAATAGEPSWSVENQRLRRQEVYALHQRYVGPLFDARGNWSGPGAQRGTMPLWNALSFLQSKDTAAIGNALLRHLIAENTGHEGPSHFINQSSVQVLLGAPDQMDPAVAADLRTFVSSCLRNSAATPIEFLGYNDNFPSMETMFSVLGGELLDEAPSFRRGMEGLERCLDLLERRGLLSEYTSTTYSPVSLLCYAGIAEYARDKRAAAMGLEVERRIWQDLALHFHAPTNILAGPHARAYGADSGGHPHLLHMTLYHVFGNEIWMNPVRYFFPEGTPKQIIHVSIPFMQASVAWLASGTYHPDAGIHRLLFAKKFPFRVAATAEEGSYPMPVKVRSPEPTSPFTDSSELFEYAAAEIVSRTYMTKDFALGTSSGQAHRYQSDAFFVNFRRAQAPAQLADVSTIFCRYSTDDHWPGRPSTNPRIPGDEPNTDLFAEEGRCHAVQKDTTALVLYQSKGELLDSFKSLRLTLVVPVMYRPLRGIWCGGQRVESLPFTAQDPQTIWLEDDFLLASFRPLPASDVGRPYAVLIQEINGYLTISFLNYQGEPKRFSRKELLMTRNGFVAELSSPLTESLAAFRQRLAAATVRDELAATDQRTVDYRRPGVRLSLSHSLYYDGLKFAAIDGKQQPGPNLEYSEGV
jgi:hypothetical protein